MSKTGYINGSDLLFLIAGEAIGHATSHTLSFSAEPKERAVKPVADAAVTAAMFKERSVVSMDIQLTAEGIRNYSETEGGFKRLMAAYKSGKPVEVKAFERGEAADYTIDPYLVANFIITNLEQSAPAQDDATYSATLQIAGAPSVWDPEKLTGETLGAIPIAPVQSPDSM